MNDPVNNTVLRHAIRESIVNDFGVSRDAIRTEFRDIVGGVAEKYLIQPRIDAILEAKIITTMDKHLKGAYSSLDARIIAEIDKQVKAGIALRVERLVNAACKNLGGTP